MFVLEFIAVAAEMFTPLFAIARVVGWSAHRMEELVNSYKIIRPAYTSIAEIKEYIPINER